MKKSTSNSGSQLDMLDPTSANDIERNHAAIEVNFLLISFQNWKDIFIFVLFIL